MLASEPADLIVSKPWLRAYADAKSRVVDSVEADNRLAAEVIDGLRLQRIADTIPRFTGGLDDLDDMDAIESHAHVVRAAADIDEGAVVRNARRAMERLGVVILPMRDELGRH